MKKLFLEDYANMTGEDLPLSQDDVFLISEKIDRADEWLTEKVGAQLDIPAHKEPALKVLDITVKERTLYTAGEILVKKIKYWKPPKPTEPPTVKPPKEETEDINADEEPATDDAKTDKEVDDELLQDETGDEPAADEPVVDDTETTEEPPSTHDPTDL